jgi:hypothetical protein
MLLLFTHPAMLGLEMNMLLRFVEHSPHLCPVDADFRMAIQDNKNFVVCDAGRKTVVSERL